MTRKQRFVLTSLVVVALGAVIAVFWPFGGHQPADVEVWVNVTTSGGGECRAELANSGQKRVDLYTDAPGNFTIKFGIRNKSANNCARDGALQIPDESVQRTDSSGPKAVIVRSHPAGNFDVELKPLPRQHEHHKYTYALNFVLGTQRISIDPEAEIIWP